MAVRISAVLSAVSVAEIVEALERMGPTAAPALDALRAQRDVADPVLRRRMREAALVYAGRQGQALETALGAIASLLPPPEGKGGEA